ncbi:hypothetical protein [Streptomyces sp. SLBN-8D4]|uniref:hypothetical protein n=1 Tax=Streptomyces sp. SLBN-8D4 TaxID=3377728 RepID=UPI003C7D5B0C
MPAAIERVIAAYEAAGFTVELAAHQNPEHYKGRGARGSLREGRAAAAREGLRVGNT